MKREQLVGNPYPLEFFNSQKIIRRQTELTQPAVGFYVYVAPNSQKNACFPMDLAVFISCKRLL